MTARLYDRKGKLLGTFPNDVVHNLHACGFLDFTHQWRATSAKAEKVIRDPATRQEYSNDPTAPVDKGRGLG